MTQAYFTQFEQRKPPDFPPMSQFEQDRWHFLAGSAIAAALWYLQWRWTVSINPDAMVFSTLVALAAVIQHRANNSYNDVS